MVVVVVVGWVGGCVSVGVGVFCAKSNCDELHDEGVVRGS